MNTRYPGPLKVFDDLQCIVVVDVPLDPIELKDHKNVAGRYNPLDRMIRLKAFEVKYTFNQAIEWRT